jgi:hypothetical protein
MTKITEFNCETGIEIVRDMTKEELAAYNSVVETMPKDKLEETP